MFPTSTATSAHPLRYAMIGGGHGAFIGAVHRKAMALDGRMELVAGALSATAEKARSSGQALGLSDDRNHTSWQALLEDELKRPPEQRIHFISIVTPNHIHYPVAHAFVEAGFNVVCDKPLVHTYQQALSLASAVDQKNTLFAVTYNYTGYPMVRQARHMIKTGVLGDIRKITVEYNQGWLAHHQHHNKQAVWRSDPKQSGIAGAMGDIGSHAENLISTMTGLEIESLCADLTTFVDHRLLDDDGSVLLRFTNGARGVLAASQVVIGFENALHIRISGTQGSVVWHQEQPNQLLYYPSEGPLQILTRGSAWLCDAAKHATRLPAGHPESFIEAFANIYLGVAEALSTPQAELQSNPLLADFPHIEAGVRGVRFIEKVVESAHSNQKWIPF